MRYYFFSIFLLIYEYAKYNTQPPIT